MIDKLESIIIVRQPHAYQATARFSDPHLDFMICHSNKIVLYAIIEHRMSGWRRRR